ncbi:hypothetical protein E4U43_004805 [Claviceps pusilla]|uniref:Myb-like domain-containing protein n=1 Tax=Claviceps pusilla TaxID=123648 RepID=A0A9P7NHA5_9HYPO|nr:hypothetical protein E4U43_004805 [Claviceps pusilla]
MSSKSWTDRADKDLFFTILSVKNIGIISGGEWSTIGNHMRSMGYGFTNEGCRQHFQGLRRAQSKAEATGTVPYMDNVYHSDPTQNPITRRPGPGRGRPKKHSLSSEPAVGQVIADNPVMLSSPGTVHSASPAYEQHGQHGQHAVGEVAVGQGHGAPSQPHANLSHSTAPSSAITADATAGSFRAEDASQEKRDGDGIGTGIGHGSGNGNGNGNDNISSSGNGNGNGNGNISSTGTGNANGNISGSGSGSGTGAAGEGEGGDADAEGVDEPPVKRQRLGGSPDLGQPAPLDEDAVLALAAHNGVSGPDFHGSFPYGET